jgi:outer membrane lipoprotein carrier protein
MLKKLLIFVTFTFLHAAAYAETAAASLSQLLANIQTLQADFTQTITDKNAKQIQHSDGRMSLQRPGKFRWEVKKPLAQLVVTNGTRLWIYDPDLEQVTIRFLSKEVGESPAMLLSNTNVALEKDYDVQAMKDSKLQWFVLTPKSQNSMFAQIRFGFYNQQIREMVLQDHLGHTTAVEFYNIKVNPALSSALFVFKAPAHVDIIDETKH